jgi:3-oxoadipate enol-lactonase
VSDHAVTTEDGVRLRVRVDGAADAPVLLLCNSLGTDLTMWDRQVGMWAERFRVVRFDTRGHGGSSVPAPPYTIDDLGTDAVAVLDAHDAARAHVCGASLGGLVALWLAVSRPERVDRLVLADTAARVGTEEGWTARVDAVRRGGTASVRDAVMERFFSAGFRERDPATVSAAGDILSATSDDGYVGACQALAVADLRSRVGDVRARTLVVVGSEDEATPPSDARALHDGIAGSVLHTIPGAGHLANLERPDAFAEVVTSFLTAAADRP